MLQVGLPCQVVFNLQISKTNNFCCALINGQLICEKPSFKYVLFVRMIRANQNFKLKWELSTKPGSACKMSHIDSVEKWL